MSVSFSKELYIKSYNRFTLVGWSIVLYLTLSRLFKRKDKYKSVYDSVYPVFRVVQTASILESTNALFGLVKTPKAPTFLQLFFRMFFVYGVCTVPQTDHWSYAGMITIWSMAEITRFLYYELPNSALLKKARYSGFLFYFPVGFFFELAVCYHTAKKIRKTRPNLYKLIGTVCYSAIFGLFPALFYYMIKQRSAHIRHVKQ